MKKELTNIRTSYSFPKRLVSIDALRGFDMFWIMGGDYLLRSLYKIKDCPFTRVLGDQMHHVPYEGLHFYDIIFPVFIFIVGVSITLALPSTIEKKGKTAALKRIIFRAAILFLLGIFYMGGIEYGIKNIYFAGVLQRISLAYLFSAIIFCFFRTRGIIIITVSLLVGYYMLLSLVPVPGFGEPSFEQGRNLAHFIDQWLPGQKFEGTLLSTLGAVANALIGVLIGLLIKHKNISDQKKVLWVFISGFSCLFIGYLWGIWFPLIKAIWTSSYVLVTCGYGMVVLGIFFQVIEIWNFQLWARPFIWIGMNSIAIYIAAAVMNFRKLSLRLVGGEVNIFLGNFSDLVIAIITLLFVFWLAWFLYNKKIFIKV